MKHIFICLTVSEVWLFGLTSPEPPEKDVGGNAWTAVKINFLENKKFTRYNLGTWQLARPGLIPLDKNREGGSFLPWSISTFLPYGLKQQQQKHPVYFFNLDRNYLSFTLSQLSEQSFFFFLDNFTVRAGVVHCTFWHYVTSDKIIETGMILSTIQKLNIKYKNVLQIDSPMAKIIHCPLTNFSCLFPSRSTPFYSFSLTLWK